MLTLALVCIFANNTMYFITIIEQRFRSVLWIFLQATHCNEVVSNFNILFKQSNSKSLKNIFAMKSLMSFLQLSQGAIYRHQA